MKLLGWFRRGAENDDRLSEWRAVWERAIAAPETASVHDLRQALDGVAPGTDVEVELEMLEALEHLRQLADSAARGVLPTIETQHRVVGTEPCHFTAPASLPLDDAPSSGRVLATPTRAIFVGAGRTHATPWHSVHQIVRMERDVLLLRADRTPAAHFRFNTYGDAVAAAFLACHFELLRRSRL
jgi:hypothetical protein